jgi:hypothetical protein
MLGGIYLQNGTLVQRINGSIANGMATHDILGVYRYHAHITEGIPYSSMLPYCPWAPRQDKSHRPEKTLPKRCPATPTLPQDSQHVWTIRHLQTARFPSLPTRCISRITTVRGCNCVGAGNLKHFILFLVYIGCVPPTLALFGWNYFFVRTRITFIPSGASRPCWAVGAFCYSMSRVYEP